MTDPSRVPTCLGLAALGLLGPTFLTGCGGGSNVTSSSSRPISIPNPGTTSYSVYAVLDSGVSDSDVMAPVQGSSVQQYTAGSSGDLTATGTPLTFGSGIAALGLALSSGDRYAVVSTDNTTAGVTLGNGKYQELTVGTGGALSASAYSFGSGDEDFNGVAFSPDGRYAYAVIISNANETTAESVQQYTVGTGGALTPTGTPLAFSGGTIALGIVLSPDGVHGYILEHKDDTNTGQIQPYRVGTGGALTALGSPLSVGTGIIPLGLTFSPSGQYAYAIDSGSNNVYGLIQEYVAGAGGTLTAIGSPITPIANSGFTGLAFSPDGTRAYAAEENTNFSTSAIQPYSVGTVGSLTATGTPINFANGTLVLGLGVLPAAAFAALRHR